MNRKYYQINHPTTCLGGCLSILLFLSLFIFVGRAFFWLFGPLIIGLIILLLVRRLFGSGDNHPSHKDIDPLYDDRNFEEIDDDEIDN